MYVYFGKVNQERDKLNLLIDSILSNFFLDNESNKPLILSIDNVNYNFTVSVDSLIEEIIDETRKLENVLYPDKNYYLSEKMNFTISRNVKNMSIKIGEFINKKILNNEYLAITNLKIKHQDLVKSGEVKSIDNIIIEEEEGDDVKQKEADDYAKIEPTPKINTNIKLSNNLQEDLKFNISMEINHEKQNQTNLQCTNNTQQKLKPNKSRSFFGYYNFYNFFNHFVILYERLKFMKSLTNQNEGYTFMKKLLFLKLTNTIDSELFDDICSCLLSEYKGVFLNLDKILSNIIKEIPIHEIDQFVLESNTHLFYKHLGKYDSGIYNNKCVNYPKTITRSSNNQMLLFLQTCHKLNSLTIKSKPNTKQTQIQSYINNNNIVNDHILKFEFRSKDKMFVIHKIKSIFKQPSKKVMDN